MLMRRVVIGTRTQAKRWVEGVHTHEQPVDCAGTVLVESGDSQRMWTNKNRRRTCIKHYVAFVSATSPASFYKFRLHCLASNTSISPLLGLNAKGSDSGYLNPAHNHVYTEVHPMSKRTRKTLWLHLTKALRVFHRSLELPIFQNYAALRLQRETTGHWLGVGQDIFCKITSPQYSSNRPRFAHTFARSQMQLFRDPWHCHQSHRSGCTCQD